MRLDFVLGNIDYDLSDGQKHDETKVALGFRNKPAGIIFAIRAHTSSVVIVRAYCG